MPQKIFITGTDTEIGKTYVTAGLIDCLQQQGYSAVGLKPLSCGCIKTKTGLRNEDALALQQASSLSLPYSVINPIAYYEPIAPHIAAEQSGDSLCVDKLIKQCEQGLSQPVNQILIEGVGGWSVPLNDKETMADFVIALRLPVIMVVGLRLGCLNHTLLTYAAICSKRVPLLGWIGNCIDPNMPVKNENIVTLQQRIHAPLLAVVPFGGKINVKW